MTHSMIAGLAPTHPGELLRKDVLPSLERPIAQIARMLGMSRQHLHDILIEKKPVSTATALRLAKLLGGNAEFWVCMQASYDLAIQEKTMAEELAKIPVLEVA